MLLLSSADRSMQADSAIVRDIHIHLLDSQGHLSPFALFRAAWLGNRSRGIHQDLPLTNAFRCEGQTRDLFPPSGTIACESPFATF